MTDVIETLPPSEDVRSTEEPAATLHGNGYDLTALGALVSGALLLFLCLTCNMGFYCLPLVPLVLGVLGVVGARRAVNRQQSQTFAWLGLGTGALAILMMAAGFVLYFGLVVLVILAEGNF